MSMIVNISPSSFRVSLLAKRAHKYPHALYNEMIDILSQGGCIPGIKSLCRQIVDACLNCAQPSVPVPSKISLTHVCEAFYQKVQADFTFANIRETKCCVLSIMDSATCYYKSAVASRRCGEPMAENMETIWVLMHGASHYLAADSGLTKDLFSIRLAGPPTGERRLIILFTVPRC